MNVTARITIRLRLAINALATDLAEAAVRHHEARLERLAKQEIDLRIAQTRARPLRHTIILPE